MVYLYVSIRNAFPEYIVAENESKEGIKFFTISEDIYLNNKKYQIYVYEYRRLESKNISIDRFAFLKFHSLQLFKFLISIKGIGPKGAIKIIESCGGTNNLLTLLESGIGIESVGTKSCELISKAMKKKKNKQIIEALFSLADRKNSIRSEALWILQEMELDRNKCIKILDKIDQEIEGGIEGMKVEDVVKEVLARNVLLNSW